jgi:hypothetical protein
MMLLVLSLFNHSFNLSFEKSDEKNSFEDKNIIPICCAWGPELQKGVLTYSIQDESDNEKIADAVAKAAEQWNTNLNGIQLLKASPPTGNENIVISFVNDGKKVAGKTINSIDSNGFIRKSYITLSREYFNHPFSNSQLEQVAEHEFGHVLGLNHANFNGNLMTSQVNKGSKTISPCVIEAVNIANAWKISGGGVSMYGPTKPFVTC